MGKEKGKKGKKKAQAHAESVPLRRLGKDKEEQKKRGGGERKKEDRQVHCLQLLLAEMRKKHKI